MIVGDIYSDVKEITGFTDEATNFSRIADAVEALNNKGNFDALLGYVTLRPVGNLITLPVEVDTPLKINIDNNPSFARDRLYEFTQNGPGSNSERVGWSWEDAGTTPIFNPQPTPREHLRLVTSNPADNGKKVVINGMVDQGFGPSLYSATLVLNNLSYQATTGGVLFTSISSISKEVTAGNVSLNTVETNKQLANYLPWETEPLYRQVRISKPGATAYILFRRKNFRVYSMRDQIPVRSKMGLLFMIKALEAWRNKMFTEGDELEKQAIAKTTEAQDASNSFLQVAGHDEAAILNLNYNNIDSIIVADIYDETCKIVGSIGRSNVFDKITEAKSVLGRKAQWDSLRGFVDIQTDQYEYVTLPRYVESVIKINVNGQPTEMKNKWFEFHLNGPGERWNLIRSWQDAGDVVTLRDVPYVQYLSAHAESPLDDGLTLRVYGFHDGKEIFTTGDDGTEAAGFDVVANVAGFRKGTQPVDRITRITKPASNGFIKLSGFDGTGSQKLVLGYYYPDETEPRYRRIRLSESCACVRIMYRLRSNKVSSLTDPIHLRSKLAILTMLRAIETLNMGKPSDAQEMEDKAVMLLVDEQRINNQGQVPIMEFSPSWKEGYGGYIR